MERSTTTLRKLLAKPEPVIAPGAYDPFTARMIESLGFPAVYMGGNATGVQLGVGEPLTTLTETVDQATRILRGIDVPLIVDADAGFGDPIHTYRTVRELERAGVAAIHLEDQVFPKRASYHRSVGQTGLTPINETLDKLKAALDARRDPDFLIIARTDALRIVSMEAAIERCLAYQETGVDMLFIAGGATPDEGRRIRQSIKDAPMVWLTGTSVGGADLSTREIGEMGYQLVLYSGAVMVVVAEAALKLLTHLRDTGRTGLTDDRVLPTVKQIYELIGFGKYWTIEAATTERQ